MTAEQDKHVEHPKFQEIIQKGCDACLARRATLVYLNLCEANLWWDVELHYCTNLKLPYVTGRQTKHSARSVVVPVDVSPGQLSFATLLTYTSLSSGNESLDKKSVILALCDGGSQIVYYEVFNGIKELGKPDLVESRKKKRMDASARRKRVANSAIAAWTSAMPSQCAVESDFEDEL